MTSTTSSTSSRTEKHNPLQLVERGQRPIRKSFTQRHEEFAALRLSATYRRT